VTVRCQGLGDPCGNWKTNLALDVNTENSSLF
jgi:hypothetical protein